MIASSQLKTNFILMKYTSSPLINLRSQAFRLLLVLAIPLLVISCTAGDRGSEKVPDSVGIDTSGNQNPTAVGEAGPSIPADTAAAGNEPNTGTN